jgi:hypothetical protein
MATYNSYLKLEIQDTANQTFNIDLSASPLTVPRYNKVLVTNETMNTVTNVIINLNNIVYEDTELEILFDISLLPTSTVTVAGNSIPAEALANKTYLKVFRSKSVWKVFFMSDADKKIVTSNIENKAVTNDKIGNKAVATGNIADNAIREINIKNNEITGDKLKGSLNQHTITVPVSFETGEQSQNSIIIGGDLGKLLELSICVTKAIEATDDALVTLQLSNVVLDSITLPGGTAINTIINTTLPNNSFVKTPYQKVDFIAAKTTAGGKALATLVFEKY